MCTTKFKVDEQVKTVIDNCFISGHRSLLFLYNDPDSLTNNCGQKVMLIHHLITKNFKERPSVLWCHHKNSSIPKIPKRKLKELEKEIKSGKTTISSDDAFGLFMLSTSITFSSFKETENILGRTFGMCIIQDFESLTPNIICRITETVIGGGAIIFLLPKCIKNLKSLYTYPMDVHSKFTNHCHSDVHHRFNERFVLSLGWCKTCLVLNKDFEICYEITANKNVLNALAPKKVAKINEEEEKMSELLESVSDLEKPVPQLLKLCKTNDQAKAVFKMIDVISEKGKKSVVSITAGRGRGKSAALGLATAAAIYSGLNNIYVTSPSPQNLHTFFEFVFKGFDALDYEENTHYNITQSTNPEFEDSIIRVTVFAKLRQVIQYVSPSDYQRIRHTELVIIDEVAAIPLAYVKPLVQSHSVFMASTVNGYEGTGRSLSLKLMKELQKQAASSMNVESFFSNSQSLFELPLEKSIRYQPNDPVEKWIYRLMCLDSTSTIPTPTLCPHPDSFELFYVNRDVLFSGHPDTEEFLHQIFSLLVSSHYKNSPNDLQMLCDSPSQHLFVLIPPVSSSKKVISIVPTVFAVVQVSVEGGIPTKLCKQVLSQGKREDGDLIPWFLVRERCSPKLGKMKAVRILRIATHPDYQSMGYGSRAMKLLKEYYQGRFISLEEKEVNKSEEEENKKLEENSSSEEDSILIAPKHVEEPLLSKLSERSPESIDYIGVSFGITEQLFKFWKKNTFFPIHISSSENKVTGEYNCIMVSPLTEESSSAFPGSDNEIPLPKWMQNFIEIFYDRFLDELSTCFVNFSLQFALSIITSVRPFIKSEEIDWENLEFHINVRSLARLELYSKNLAEKHHITNLFRPIAELVFRNRIPSVHLSQTQLLILLGVGLQYLSIDDVSKKGDLDTHSVLGQFHRTIKRMHKCLTDIHEKSVTKEVEAEVVKDEFTPVTLSLEEDLENTAYEFENPLQSLPSVDFNKYAINVDETRWNEVTKGNKTTISIKRNKRPRYMTQEEIDKEIAEPEKKGNKKFNKNNNNNNNKKRR